MPEALAGLKTWPAGKRYWSPLGQLVRGRFHMLGDTRRSTAFVDFTKLPLEPVVHNNAYVLAFDELPDGRFVACAMPTKPEGQYGVHFYAAGWPQNPAAEPLRVLPCPGGINMVNVWSIAGHVVAHERLIDGKHPPATHRAYLLEGDQWLEAPGLQPVTKFRGSKFLHHQEHGNGKVTLGDGTDVFVWDGDGYEWTGTQFEKRWELAAGSANLDGLVTLPWGAESFFYSSSGKVMFARRGEKPVRVLPDVNYAHFLSHGPNDSVFVCMHGDPKSHIVRQWFPADGTYVPLKRAHLGYGRSARSPDMYWSAATKLVHVSALYTFPDSSLSDLKRVRPKEKGYVIESDAPATGGELVEREFLTREVWDQLDPHTAETVARAVARCLPEPWAFINVKRCACGDQKRCVAIFNHTGHDFALIPGGVVTLGYDPARPLPNAKALREWAKEARALTGSKEPAEVLWRQYLEGQLSKLRTVELKPYLLAVNPHSKRVKTGRAERSKIAKEGFALPTADQWEFAASGGSRAVWHWGDAPPKKLPTEHAFGLNVLQNSYVQEALDERGTFRGGDGGQRAHGGADDLEWYLALSPWYVSQPVNATQEDWWQATLYRRAFALPDAMFG
jgi:hypothetical protein